MSIKELSKTSMQSILGVIVVLGGFLTLVFETPAADVKIAIVGMMSMVLGYYFGSSKSSNAKDETIASQLTEKN
jgi:hydrogenase/urease accessory protein HupE